MRPQPRIYVITNNHFDPTWRRCWDRRFTFGGDTFVSYAEIEDYYITDNLALARAHPEYKFEVESTVVARKYLERHPEALAELRALADRGRFTVSGAGDNVIDVNMTLGETIVRNFLYGLLWVEENLGRRTCLAVRNDGFGNSAQLPQILRGCEMKWVRGLSYSPCRGLYWRGLDGSVVCSAGVPTVGRGGDWSKHPPCPECGGAGGNCSACQGRGIRATWHNPLPGKMDEAKLRAAGAGTIMLTPEERLPNPEIIGYVRGLRRKYDARFALLEECLDERSVQQALKRVDDPPARDVHPGVELNPNNSGVWVTRIKLKQDGRRQEYALLAAESLNALAALAGAPYPRQELLALWQTLLFTMFHDAITATHVDPAYAELRDMQSQIDAGTLKVRDLALARLRRAKSGVLSVLNLTGAPQTQLVSACVPEDGVAQGVSIRDAQGRAVPVVGWNPQTRELMFLARHAAAFSTQAFAVSAAPPAPPRPRQLRKPVIENERFRIAADEHGLTSIYDKQLRRIVSKTGNYRPGELLQERDIGSPWATLHADRRRVPLAPRTEFLRAEATAAWQRLSFRVRSPGRDLGCLELFDALVTVTLYRGLERADFRVDLRYNAYNTRVRVALPVAGRGAHYYGIPYGVLRRRPYAPRFENWAAANGDWPAINWAGVQTPRFSAALLSKGLPSYTVEKDRARREVILLSLVRSPSMPTYLHEPHNYSMTDFDGMRDAGDHRFEFAVAAYAGTFAESRVVLDAEGYNAGLQAVPGVLDLPQAPQVRSDHVHLSALKLAELGAGLIVRLVEFRGRAGVVKVALPGALTSCARVNLLEREALPLEVRGGCVEFAVRPWEIVTLRME